MQRHLPQYGARGLPPLLEQLLYRGPVHAWIFILICADMAVLADAITGPDVWFGPIYLFVICLAAWGLGWWCAHITGIGCMLLTFSINGASLYPHGAIDVGSNLAVRVFTISVVITLICALRWGYLREWWLARTDLLSGTLNRQAFFELGSVGADDHKWRLLVYADLDGLKVVNDQLGHVAGDELIKAYALRVKRAIRRDDLFARIGGDEFVIFMAVQDLGSAKSVAGRLHQVMNASDAGINCRCSVGALIIPPGSMSIDDLVRRADALMYRAKQRGACLEVEVEGMKSKHNDKECVRAAAKRLPNPTLRHDDRRRANR